MKFGKFGSAFLHGICIAGACTIDATITGGTLTALTLKKPALSALKDLLIGTSAQALINQLPKLGISKTLGEVYDEALVNSLESVKKEFLTNQEIKGVLFKKIERMITGVSDYDLTQNELFDTLFFEPLIRQLKDEERINEVLQSGKELQIHELITHLILKDETINFPNFIKTENQKRQLLNLISNSFTRQFLFTFDNKLSENPNALTDYQNQLLRRLQENLLEVRDGVEYIKEAVRRKAIPPLTLHDTPNQSDSRRFFSHENAHTRFVGREYELGIFHSFLDSEDSFQWLMLSGSGGSGKSRLAQHIGIEAKENGWYAGFLDTLEYNFDDLNPERNLLIFIDYAKMKDSERLKIMFKSLYRFADTAQKTDPKKVRVVLIERFFDENFLRDITSEITRKFYYIKENEVAPINIQPLDATTRWEIMKQLIGDSAVLTDEQKNELSAQQTILIKDLDELDDEKRPLFAFIFGFAISVGEKEQLGKRTINDALAFVINRLNDTYWTDLSKKYSVPLETIKTLAMVAALCEEITYEQMASLIDSDEDRKSTQRLFKNLEVIEIHELLSSVLEVQTNNETELSYLGLKPDLIAEYLALTHLHHLNRSKKETCYSLLKQLWSLRPEGMSNMLFLTYQNFSKDPRFVVIDHFLKLFENNTITDLHYYFSYIQNAGMTVFSNNWNVQPIDDLYEKAVSIKKGNEQLFTNEKLAVQHAETTFTLALLWENAKHPKRAQPFYQEIKTLREEHENAFALNPKIALQQAKAAYNLALAWGIAEHPEQAQSIYKEIKALREDHENAFALNSDIALQQASAAYNLALAWGKAKHPERAQSIYKEIKALREEHENAFALNPDIALQQAKAAYNLALDWGKAKHPERAQSIYKEIKALREEHENAFALNPDIALQQASAAYNLALDWGIAKHPERAQSIYKEIKALREEHENAFALNPDIALRQARAAYNLALDWGKAKHPERAQSIYKEIKALREEHENAFALNPDIALQQASAAYNLALDWGIAKHPERAQSIYKEIKALREEHENAFALNPDIALQQASAAYNLLNWGIAKHPEQKQQLYQEIKALREEHENAFALNPDIALQQASAAYNLVLAWRKAKHPERAQSIYKEIKALREEHGNAFALKPDIALWHTKTGLYLANLYLDKNLELARKYFNESEEIYNAFIDNNAFRELDYVISEFKKNGF